MTIRNSVKNSILHMGRLVFLLLPSGKPSKIVPICYNGVSNARWTRDQHHRKRFFMAEDPNSKGHRPKNHRVPEMQMAIPSFFLKGGLHHLYLRPTPTKQSASSHRQHYLIGFNACTDNSQIQLSKRDLT